VGETAVEEVLVGSLFSGYEGIGLAVLALFPQARLAFVSDIDPGACKVLAHRFPGVPNLGDVATVDWTRWRGIIRILTGGFPCQDVSHAGKREGLMHGTRSGLWHQFARAIDELHPDLVVIENVRGLLSARGDTSEDYEAADTRVRVLEHLIRWRTARAEHHASRGTMAHAHRIASRTTHRHVVAHRRAVADRKRCERRIVRAVGTVLGTLADLGYDATWTCLRAADVGAPHGRFRVFIAAWPTDTPLDPQWLEHRDGEPAADTGSQVGVGRH
jgi:DNA (cytosine-5)-methyltransferase 1